MSTYRSPPSELSPLVPLATKYYSKHRRAELPGWRGPSEASSPGLSLSVGRPYYVTDRGVYNSQPRYPRSRGMRSSAYILPQLRKSGRMLKVQLHSGRLNLAVDESEVDNSWDPPSRSVMDKSGSHHRHASGPLDFFVGNGSKLKLTPLWPAGSLQRITRSRSTAEIESANCMFPRPLAARSQTDWDWEAEVIQERKLIRRYRPKRQAPEILFQGPPPRVRRNRAHLSSMSTVAGAGSQPRAQSEEDSEEPLATSSQCTETPSLTESAPKTAARRIASGQELQRKDSAAIATRRVASEKMTCRWPADTLDPSSPSKRTKKPKKQRPPADPTIDIPTAASAQPEEAQVFPKKKAKRRKVLRDETGEIIPAPLESFAESGSVDFSDSEPETPQTQSVTFEKQAAGGDSTAVTTRYANAEFPSSLADSNLQQAWTPSPDLDPENPQSTAPVDPDDPLTVRITERSDSGLQTDPQAAGEESPAAHQEALSLETGGRKPQRRKLSFTAVPEKLTKAEVMNLSFHSSGAIEERPDTENLSEESSRAFGRQQGRGQRETATRRPGRMQTLGKAQGGFSPISAQRRPGSKSSPGLRIARNLSQDLSFSAEDLPSSLHQSSLRQSSLRSSSKGPSDLLTDRSARDPENPLRPTTSVRRSKPKQSMHPMRKNADASPTSQERSPRLREKEEWTPTMLLKRNSSDKPGSTEKSVSSKSIFSGRRPESTQKSEAENAPPAIAEDEKPVSAATPQGAAEEEKHEDGGMTPLDVLVHNISSSVLSIVNSLLVSDPALLRAKLQPVLQRTEVKPGARRGRIGLELSPTKSQTLPKAEIKPELRAEGLTKSESLAKVSTLKRKLAEPKASPQAKTVKPAKKPISLATRATMANAKDVLAKKPLRMKMKKSRGRGQSSRSSSPASSVSEGEYQEHTARSQLRMAEYELRQLSFIQKLAQDLLTGSADLEPPAPLFHDSDDEEYRQNISNKGFDVHRRMQSMFELTRFPMQNAFTVAIEKELRMKPPPSRETILPEEIVVDRKNREDARLVQKFYAKADMLPSHDSLMSKQDGTLFQLEHNRMDPHEVKEFYIRLGRLKRHEAARRGVKLNAQQEFTFSHLELRYYLNKYAELHPRKRLVLPPVRSRKEDLYSERIYGRLKSDPNELLFPHKSQFSLRSLEASLEELEQVSQAERTARL